MSQTENAVTSSSKRIYRKGNPLTGAEKQRISVTRKKETHKAINVFIQSELKDDLTQLCEDSGLTQTEMLEHWILKEKAARENAK
ncbi:TPA: replication regulatory protein RepA [Salmonella enterica subsp. enterica serovar Mississippi]|nr:replication regulatory protein RepA [Salmonella enterica subsp. enterica]ECW0788972.1 replication regulatory protein RepA [Salmonella enterica subsp. enterica]HED0167908.1 replication regulatory protein RepA [Salmonella enterica subsp. enterica serovar Mississippi]HED0173896.1 replication regulatory protein RepA [Salmonella enterica subsp. enterica serovar Mississippi]HED0195891.1 replication regulatory protein RepA [Salmonella enterica subsp. enterica serovar Mississippi]